MNLKTTLSATLMAMALWSCHDGVFENEGDCEVKYRLQFVYDMNLYWADAFPSLVNDVTVYVFDDRGLFVKEYNESGEILSQPGYAMELDLEPGDYTLVGWCHFNDDSLTDSFSIISPQAGVTTLDDLSCSLQYSEDNGTAVSGSRLPFLYNGHMEVSLPDSQDGKEYLYTMYLTKDTNHIRVMIQQLNADLASDDFEISLTAANSKMAWDNNIISPVEITYTPWSQQIDMLTTGSLSDSGSQDFEGIVADLSTYRLTTDMPDGLLLTIRSTENPDKLWHIPVIKFAMMAKEYYETAYMHPMTDQEYLDRRDEYELTFFFDENINLAYFSINVLEWRLVFSEYEFNS